MTAHRLLSKWQATITVGFLVAVSLISPATVAAQQIQVTSADPPSAEQGTVNLNVSVKGKGFKRGAVASFVLTGTDNPDGIVVNSTTFVSSGEVVANVNVAETATISTFDIKVRNSDGRIGKGTELFAVLAKGSGNACTTLGTPAGWVEVDQLQKINPDGTGEFEGLGNEVRARPADLDGNGTVDVLVVMAGRTKLVNILLDPVTGQRLSANVVLDGFGTEDLEAGEINGDGVPDFAMGTPDISLSGNDVAHVFLSSVTGGQLTYTVKRINAPTDIAMPPYFGSSVALGDLDGDGRDELAVDASGQGIHGSKVPGTVVVYRYEGGDFVRKLVVRDPLPNRQQNSGFKSLAIGDVSGDSSGDLIVGQRNGTVDGIAGAGRVFVFPGPVLSPSFNPNSYVALTLPGVTGLGFAVAVGNVDGAGMTDVVASATDTSGEGLVAVFSGPVSAGQAPTYRLLPLPGLSLYWASKGWDVADVGPPDGRADVLVGAPGASQSCNTKVGIGYLFQSDPGWTMAGGNQATAVFQPAVLEPNNMDFGFAMAGIPGYPFILITRPGSTPPGGQVFVYKRQP